MPIFRRSFPLFALFLVIGLVLGSARSAEAQTAQQKTYTVSSLKDLLKAVAPNRIIVLQKGDYKLSTAYDFKSDYVSWLEGDDGFELQLNKLSNVTFRGADGARIVSDSGLAYMVGVYEGSNIRFENLTFTRVMPEDAEVSSGTFYAETVDGLAIERCNFVGPTSFPLEFWECENVTIKKATISGATSGALYASYVQGFELSNSSISGCEGYPLIALDESDSMTFSQTNFEGNSGGNFIEIYAEAGYVENVVFSGSTFKNQDFEYFCGTEVLPATEDCGFVDSSFDEDWAEYSVAPTDGGGSYGYGYGEDYGYGDDWEGDGGYGYDEGPAYYSHDDAGFALYYPNDWDLQSSDEGRFAIQSPYSETVVAFTTVSKLPANFDPAKQAKKAFADAAAAYAKLLKDEVGLTITIKPEGDPYEVGGFPAADYRGTVTGSEGAQSFIRVRFFISQGAVQSLAGIAGDEENLDPDYDVDTILGSIESNEY